MPRTKVFVSYAHEDERWRQEVRKHLIALMRAGLIEFWDDQRIGIGQNWMQEIHTQLLDARVALLLVSPDFLASEFIQDEEIPKLLDQHAADGMSVFPLVVEPCLWKRNKWLKGLQVRPANGVALASFDQAKAREELVAVMEEIALFAERHAGDEDPP